MKDVTKVFKKFSAKDVQVSEHPLEPSTHELTLVEEIFEDQSERLEDISDAENDNSDESDDGNGRVPNIVDDDDDEHGEDDERRYKRDTDEVDHMEFDYF